MEQPSLCCIVCFKKFSENLKQLKDKLLLKRFLKLFERYLGGVTSSTTAAEDESLIEQLITEGLVGSCEECMKIVQSFCDLFDQIKSIELIMNSHVSKLQNIMSWGNVIPSKFENLREALKKFGEMDSSSSVIDVDISLNSVMVYKKELIEKCKQKLVRAAPAISISRMTVPSLPSPPKPITVSTNDDDDAASAGSTSSPSPALVTVASNTQDDDANSTAKVFKCESCDKTFKHKKSLTNHQKHPCTKTAVRFRCEPCNMTFASKLSLSGHNRVIHEMIRFLCGYCKEMCKQPQQIQNHIIRYHQHQHIFENNSQYKFSLVKVSGNENGAAPKESITSATGAAAATAELPLPIPVVESDESCPRRIPLPQQHQQMTGSTSTAVAAAVLSNDSPSQLLKCELCPATFLSKQGLFLHERIQHEKLRYNCGYCPEIFKQSRLLKSHIFRKHQREHLFEDNSEFKFSVIKLIEDDEGRVYHQVVDPSAMAPSTSTSTQAIILEAEEAPEELHEAEEGGKLPMIESVAFGEVKIFSSPSPAISIANTKLQLLHCDLCSKTFPPGRNLSLSTHKKIFHEGFRYHCGHCSEKFTRKTNAIQHSNKMHRSPYSGKPLQLRIKLLKEGGGKRTTPQNSNSTEPEMFACEICNKTFKIKQSLKYHYQALHENVQFKCGYCPSTFRHRNYVRNHIRKFHREEPSGAIPPFKIEAVKVTAEGEGEAANNKSLRMDRGTGNVEKTNPFPTEFRCEICNITFIEKKSLASHNRALHENLRYMCGYCSKIVKYSPSIRKHIIENHQRQHVEENNSKYKFSLVKLIENGGNSNGNVVVYKRVLNSNTSAPPKFAIESTSASIPAAELPVTIPEKEVPPPTPLPIDSVGEVKIFSSPAISLGSLSSRLNKKFSCGICLQKLRSIHELSKHCDILHDGKRVKCQNCQKLFVEPYSLRRHLCRSRRTRSNKINSTIIKQEVKPSTSSSSLYCCNECGKVYSSDTALKGHYSIMHLSDSLRSHQCDFCDKRFKAKSAMQSHVNSVHLGKRSQCPHCQKLFSRTAAMHVHVKNNKCPRTGTPEKQGVQRASR